MQFTLALKTGGLMEDPERHCEKIRTVDADSLQEAKQKYAEITGLIRLPDWNPTNQTYWGWEIVEII